MASPGTIMKDTYKTIKNISQGYFRDRGSKFIAFAIPVQSESEIKDHLAGLRKEYYDARHYCYAWILGTDWSQYRINDDGEPSGSAGRPIHGQLLSSDLTNILVVIIRYFGGIKLGIPGLINAYRSATKDALENASIETRIIKDLFELKYQYPLMNDVMRIIKDEQLEQLTTKFEMECMIEISIRQKRSKPVSEKFKKIRGLSIHYLRTI